MLNDPNARFALAAFGILDIDDGGFRALLAKEIVNDSFLPKVFSFFEASKSALGKMTYT